MAIAVSIWFVAYGVLALVTGNIVAGSESSRKFCEEDVTLWEEERDSTDNTDGLPGFFFLSSLGSTLSTFSVACIIATDDLGSNYRVLSCSAPDGSCVCISLLEKKIVTDEVMLSIFQLI